MLKNNYRFTMIACYVGYVVQAIIVNFLPLLYVQLGTEFDLQLGEITALIAVMFALQLCADLFAVKLVDLIGYRASIITGHLLTGAGLILLGTLPYALSEPYAGIVIASFVYSSGGGLIEVMLSPIIEACPTKNKSGNMTLLHSFYCWGLVFTVLVTTLYFAVFGIANWRYMALVWAIVPILNTAVLSVCPINRIDGGERSKSVIKLLGKGKVIILLIMMLCGGAAEVAVAQWASTFVERGLGVSKQYGDLLGPCMFAVFMGLTRTLYSIFSGKLNIQKALTISAAVCVCGYILSFVTDNALMSLIGSSVIGVSVAILWPGVLSIGAAGIPEGGTALFALMALSGDIGCIAGPALVGGVAESASLGIGLFSAIIFPVLFLVSLVVYRAKYGDNAR